MYGGGSLAHVAKYSRGAIGRLTQHFERKVNDMGEHIKYGNQDIDLGKTHENYNLAPDRQQGQVNFIRERCHELDCLKRADVNVMASWIVTLPKDFPQEQERQFFEQSYKFLEKRYGEKNIVSAYVHKDESTPHLHFSFVPAVYDPKKDKEKVSAKECINKKDLLTFHKDLSKHMEKHFGRDIGIINEATKDGNKSIDELKRQSAADRLKEVKREAVEIVDRAKELAEKAKEQTDIMHQERKNVAKSLEKLLEKEKEIKDKISGIENIEAKKGFFGSYTIKENNYKDLIALAKHGARVDELEKKLEKVTAEYSELKTKYSKENSLEKTMERVKEQTHTKSLEKENTRLKDFISKEGLQDKYNQHIKAQQRDIGRSR